MAMSIADIDITRPLSDQEMDLLQGADMEWRSHVTCGGVVLEGYCWDCGGHVPAAEQVNPNAHLVEPPPLAAPPAPIGDERLGDAPTGETWERYRLRVYARAFGQEGLMAPAPRAADKRLDADAQKLIDEMDGTPTMPTEAYRRQQVNPAPWMKHPGREFMSWDYRGGTA